MGMREAGELFSPPEDDRLPAFVFRSRAAKDIDQTKGIVASRRR